MLCIIQGIRLSQQHSTTFEVASLTALDELMNFGGDRILSITLHESVCRLSVEKQYYKHSGKGTNFRK